MPQVEQEQEQEQEQAPRWLRSIWARLVLLVVVFFAVMSLGNGGTSALAGSAIGALLLGLVVAFAALWLYRSLIGYTERRPVVELDRSVARDQLRRGLLWGLVLFTSTMLLIAIFGGFESLAWGSFGGFLAALGISVSAAVTEEIFFRGVLLRFIEQGLGTRVALVVSALVFGLLHLVNPSATIWGALAIAVEAGLMLGAAYIATRTLWFPSACTSAGTWRRAASSESPSPAPPTTAACCTPRCPGPRR